MRCVAWGHNPRQRTCADHVEIPAIERIAGGAVALTEVDISTTDRQSEGCPPEPSRGNHDVLSAIIDPRDLPRCGASAGSGTVARTG